MSRRRVRSEGYRTRRHLRKKIRENVAIVRRLESNAMDDPHDILGTEDRLRAAMRRLRFWKGQLDNGPQ